MTKRKSVGKDELGSLADREAADAQDIRELEDMQKRRRDDHAKGGKNAP